MKMTRFIYIAALLSGASALIAETVWIKLFSYHLGGTTQSLSLVTAAFLLGLALGAQLFGRQADGWRQILRAYLTIEAAIGCYVIISPLLFKSVAWPMSWLYDRVGGGVLLAGKAIVVVPLLLLPTVLMGATLPVLIKLGGAEGKEEAVVGRVYGINTLGAFLGLCLAGFTLMPGLGLSTSLAVAGALNLLVVAYGWKVSRQGRPQEQSASASEEKRQEPVVGWRFIAALLFLAGVASLIYEVAWTRLMVLVLGPSPDSFVIILAGFILGIGLGALAWSRWSRRLRPGLATFAACQVAIGLAALVVTLIYTHLPGLLSSLYQQLRDEYILLLLAKFSVAVGASLLATVPIGLVYPLGVALLRPRYGRLGRASGGQYAWNTLGNVTGSLLAGFLLLPSGTPGAPLGDGGLLVGLLGVGGHGVVDLLAGEPLECDGHDLVHVRVRVA